MDRKEVANFFVLLMIGLFVLLLAFGALRGWGLLYNWSLFIGGEPMAIQGTLEGCVVGTFLFLVLVVGLFWGAWPTIKELMSKKQNEKDVK
jgi:hypothetical protein